jgi:hypothetical protein
MVEVRKGSFETSSYAMREPWGLELLITYQFLTVCVYIIHKKKTKTDTWAKNKLHRKVEVLLYSSVYAVLYSF